MKHSSSFLAAMAVACAFMVPLEVRAQRDRGYRETRPEKRETQGLFFPRKAYVPRPLPRFDELRTSLPSPIDDAHPLWVELYWKAWSMAFHNFHEPEQGSGFVSQFIDAAFNDNIFLWDTGFMTMFTNTAHPLVPGIGSLDNFYIKQHESGEICREIQRKTGLDFIEWANREDTTLFSRWGWNTGDRLSAFPVTYRDRTVPRPNPRLTLDALDNPILAWAELESYRVTGDSARLRMVWEPLLRYYRALGNYLLQGNGLYITDWASMDNSPRNPYLTGGGTGVDISSQMVLFARCLSEIASVIGKPSESRMLSQEAEELTGRINRLMWDDGKKFYCDLALDGTRVPVKTVAAYWALLARVATAERAQSLAAELQNPSTFGRLNPVPTCSADEAGYDPAGGYWRGAVWAPTTTMVIRGLERYGYDSLARSIALRHLAAVAEVYRNTGTIWENYAPDSLSPGKNTDGSPVMRDFVGWSGIGPILYFLEYGIGLRPDAPGNTLAWNIEGEQRTGCRNYRFNGHVTSLIATPQEGQGAPGFKLSVESDGPYTLAVVALGGRTNYQVEKGSNEFRLLAH